MRIVESSTEQNLRGFTADDLLACVNREIKMRRRVYPRWVSEKRMTETNAFAEITKMEIIAELLASLAAKDRLL